MSFHDKLNGVGTTNEGVLAWQAIEAEPYLWSQYILLQQLQYM